MAPTGRLGPVLAIAALLLTACAAGPDTVEPSGVDGLEIPTPTPDPDDFVEIVDNPWLPLEPGSAWGYRVRDGGPVVARRVSVTDNSRVVAGVATTVVHVVESSRAGRPLTDTYAWYAQDRAGNVWLFGEDVDVHTRGGALTREGQRLSWEAGVDGAQAGLAMAATPRLGDGYLSGYAPGTVEGRIEVLSLEDSQQVGGTSYDELLVTEETSPLVPGRVVRSYYASGTGLVLEETVAGGTDQLELVSFTPGDRSAAE